MVALEEYQGRVSLHSVVFTTNGRGHIPLVDKTWRLTAFIPICGPAAASCLTPREALSSGALSPLGQSCELCPWSLGFWSARLSNNGIVVVLPGFAGTINLPMLIRRAGFLRGTSTSGVDSAVRFVLRSPPVPLVDFVFKGTRR